jgi:glycosyltransferase involved in cell wall biosynthesis
MKVLMVVPRFGSGIVGGAENLIRSLALNAFDAGDLVEIATTCAVDHERWANELPAGTMVEEGLTVRRFPVSPRDEALHGELHARLIDQGRLSSLEELEFMATSVWSDELQTFLENAGDQYDILIFSPYLFGTTYWGVQAWPGRSVLIPCLHDEPYAHMACVRAMVESSLGCLFNTAAEERLARRLFDVPGGGVVGLGFDPPREPPDPGFPARRGLGRYLVYAGRLEEAKRVSVAVDYTCRFARSHDPDLRLVLIGSGRYVPPPDAREVVRLGYLDEAEKRAAFAGAVALVHPSELESLAIVLMEAWLEGTPVLVTQGSEVMSEHIALSGGGITFRDYPTFAAGVERLTADARLRQRLGSAGRDYVHATLSWAEARARLDRVLSGLRDQQRLAELNDRERTHLLPTHVRVGAGTVVRRSSGR